jgi:C-3',4' desaturase CrtD
MSKIEDAMGSDVWDVIVVGAGVAGLTAAALLQKQGMKTLLLEAHDKPGGCAGYFFHKGYTFDAGATVLMGLDPAGLHSFVYDRLGVAPPPATLIERVDAHLPDRVVSIFHDAERWTRERVEKFACDAEEARRLRAFWRRVDETADAMWRATAKLPVLPLRRLSDVLANLPLLSPDALRAAPLVFSTVADLLRRHRLDENRPLRAFLDGLLLITTQETAARSPFLNGAAGLDIYRHGIRRARGGMKSFIASHVAAYRDAGGTFKRRQPVVAIERIGPEYRVVTERGLIATGRCVVANVPVWNVAQLVGAEAARGLAGPLRKAGTGWGAMTLYVGVQAAAIPADAPLNCQILQDYDAAFEDGNSCFVSLSEPDDRLSAPAGRRTLNVSTHTRIENWRGLTPEDYAARRATVVERMMGAVRRVFPDIDGGVECLLPGTPVTFERYTRRAHGMVGGVRTGLWNSNLFGVAPTDAGLPNFWMVGDTVFPGQGTMACALSGVNAWRDISRKFAGRASLSAFKKDDASDALPSPINS